ncbi:MAG: hypothetical protein IID44_24095 [Planctomycetes bacterium]|nr:hypothetical protein [Planctomycetota bacterium]
MKNWCGYKVKRKRPRLKIENWMRIAAALLISPGIYAWDRDEHQPVVQPALAGLPGEMSPKGDDVGWAAIKIPGVNAWASQKM